MRHLNEQELVEYRYGDLAGAAAAAVEQHLDACQSCRANYELLTRVLAAVEAEEVPERGVSYEAGVWSRLAPQLASGSDLRRAKRRTWLDAWPEWFTVRRWVAAASVVALVVAAFLAGRFWPRHSVPRQIAEAPIPAQARERVLLVAVGEHLDRAQMVLLEISNAQPEQASSADEQKAEADISREQRRAQELLAANRIYRQTAAHNGDSGVASVLDELEPVLLEIAHSPSSVTPQQLEELRRHIEARGLLLKVRVLDSTVQREEKAAAKSESQTG
jgi:hypothetical protein